MAQTKDFYDILGLKKDAKIEDIKRVYRKLAHKYHPDKEGGDARKFKEVSEAYQVLSDPQKRAQYDQFGAADVGSQPGGGGADAGAGYGGFDAQGFDSSDMFSGGMGDIFDQFFTGGGRGRTRAKRGSDLETQIEITLEEAAKGAEREIPIYKREKCEDCKGSGAEDGKTKICVQCKGQGQVRVTQNTMFGAFAQVVQCPKCQGEGKIPEKSCKTCGGDGRVRKSKKLKIKIPAGVANEQTIKLSGEGEAGPKDGISGDLYINVAVKSDSRFKRQGDNLISELNLSFTEAALGITKRVDTLEGKIDLKIPAGTQPDKVFQVTSKGIKHLNRAGSGDLLIKTNVIIPKKLNSEQRELLKEFQQAEEKSGFWPFK